MEDDLRKKLQAMGQAVQNRMTPLDAAPAPAPAPMEAPSNMAALLRRKEAAEMNNPQVMLMKAQEDMDAASLRSYPEEQAARARFADLQKRIGMSR